MCLFRLIFCEKYDWSSHSMMKCKFKKVNNWTTTTYALMGAFDYTTNGVTMPVQSCMIPWSRQPADRIQGFYWPLIGHRPVQAYFTYDTISPTWRTRDTGCFTFCSITVYMDNICKPIHSFHHNRHYTDPKYSEGFSGVFNHQMAQGRLIIRRSFVKLKLCI